MLNLQKTQNSSLLFVTVLPFSHQSKAQTDPEVKKRIDEALKLREEGGYLPNAPKEVQDRLAKLSEEMTVYYFERSQKDFENALTPEQLKIVHETEIALLPEIGMVNPAMFEALDLSDEQRKEMEAIKTEMEAQFNLLVEDAIKAQNDIKDLLYSYLKNEKIASHGEFEKKFKETHEKPDCQEKIKKIRHDHNERGRQFLSRFKTKMLDVLTDEQLAKMGKLINEPPAYLAKFLENSRKQREAMAKAGQWQPGPGSWQPGDPIPKEYLEQRKARFPKK